MYREFKMESELYHHGVKGQRWGVRRYQNKDGTRTAAGKKRRASDDSGGYFSRFKKNGKLNVSSKKSKPEEIKKVKAKSKKKISEMSDSELKEKINRMQLEKQALSLEKDIASLNPRKVSTGEKFAKALGDFGKNAVAPAVTNAGKAYIEKALKEQLGLNEKDTVDALSKLKKEVQTMQLEEAKYKINQQRKDRERNSKKTKEEKGTKNQDSAGTSYSNPGSSKPTSSGTASGSKWASWKSKDSTGTSSSKKTSSGKKDWQDADWRSVDDDKVYSGTVVGEGTSKKSKTSGFSSIPKDWVDVDYTDVSDSTVASGQNYVSNLLLLQERN